MGMVKKLNSRRIHGLCLPIFAIVLICSRAISGEPELISYSSDGKNGSRSSFYPQVSADGRFVVFESNASLTLDDENKTADVYLFDRSEKQMTRILGADPKRDNRGPSIGSDGSAIVFHSTTKEDVARKKPRASDIVVYKRKEKTARVVTSGFEGEPHDGEALFPKLVGRNGFVLFTSNGSNLLSEKTAAIRQVYLYDRNKNQTVVLSKNREGIVSNRSCGDPKMSEDGSILVFRSAATNLIPGVPVQSLTGHLYYLNRRTSYLFQIDDFRKGFDENAFITGAWDMDLSGKVVVFEGRKRDLEDPDSALNSVDLFLYDLSSNTVEIMTTGIFSHRSRSPSLSGDGRYMAFVFMSDKEEIENPGGLVVYDRKEDRWKQVATGECSNPVFSRDGSIIVYELIEEKPSQGGKKGKVGNIYAVSNPFTER